MRNYIILLCLVFLPVPSFAKDKKISDILPAGEYQLNTSSVEDDKTIPRISSERVTVVYRQDQPHVIIRDVELIVYHSKDAFLFYFPPAQEEDGPRGMLVYSGRMSRGVLKGKALALSPGTTDPWERYFNLVPVKKVEKTGEQNN